MSHSSTCCRLSASSKQRVSWWVLCALLFIQINVALAGCLITDALPTPQPTMQMQVGEPCTEHGSTGQQLCMKHCAQSSDALKLTADLPIFAPAILPSILPLFAVADVVSLEPPEQLTPAAGPPPYLRFLRLLN
jgi:hypothetical protein